MSSHCPVCGKPYIAKRRQLRLGADEPDVEVKCICNTDISNAQILMAMASANLLCVLDPTVYGPALEDSHLPLPVVLGLGELAEYGRSTTEFEIRMDRIVSKLVYKSVRSPVTERTEFGVPTSVRVGNNVMSGKLRLRSDEAATVKYTEAQVPICPGMNLCRSREVPYLRHIPLGLQTPQYIDQSYMCIIRTKRVYHNDWVMRCDYHKSSDTYSSELELLGNKSPSKAIISSALNWIHTSFGHMPSLSRYIPERLILECRLNCTQVIDVLHPPKGVSVFRWKTDGEQCWVIGCGYVWYICRPDRPLTVLSWEISTTYVPFDGNSVTVIRAEQVTDGSLIYIDVLCCNGVSMTPIRQHIPAVMQLANLKSHPRLVIRPEFTTLKDAVDTLENSGIPADGIVCVEGNTSVTYRLKAPTIDLMRDKGELRYIGDKDHRLRLKPQFGMRQGRIYECTVGYEASNLSIKSWTPRFDKLVPNRREVVEAVIARASGTTGEPWSLMRKISSWSFLVRKRVYETAVNMCTSGPLVVDVGSGRLQSYSVMSSVSLVFLLCDPNLDLTILRRSDVCYDVTNFDEASIVSSMRNCVRTRVKYIAYRGTIRSLMSKPLVSQYIRNSSVPICYSFSLSWTYESFRMLAGYGLPQVGCCYLYDGVDDDGILINDSGVSVRLSPSDSSKGLVSMPPEPTYEEHALRLADLGPNASADSSPTCIEDIATAEISIRDIFAHVYVVTST